MFPSEWQSTVTVYPLYTNKDTGEQTNIRCVLKRCLVIDNTVTAFEETGNYIVNNIKIRIPFDKNESGAMYVTPEEWENLSVKDVTSGKYWTVDDTVEENKMPIISTFENPNVFEWALPDSKKRITAQEAIFLKNNKKSKRIKKVVISSTSDLDIKQVILI